MRTTSRLVVIGATALAGVGTAPAGRSVPMWVGAVAVVAEEEGTPHERADEAFRAERFDEAADRYGRITEGHPEDAVAWYRLGYALHALGRYEEAAEVHRKAATFDGQRTGALYNLACASALLGREEKAIEALGEAVEAGFTDAALMESDADLASVRDDPRFQELLEAARENEAALPIHHFDFWVGRWDVFNPEGTKVGENVIRSLHDGRVIEENWTSVRGGTGMSLNFYDPERKAWRQTWVDMRGGIVEYEGSFRDGAMRMEGWHIHPDGSRTLQRVAFTPGEDGTVRQFIEESSDGGKTWTTYFDGLYVRRERE